MAEEVRAETGADAGASAGVDHRHRRTAHSLGNARNRRDHRRPDNSAASCDHRFAIFRRKKGLNYVE